MLVFFFFLLFSTKSPYTQNRCNVSYGTVNKYTEPLGYTQCIHLYSILFVHMIENEWKKKETNHRTQIEGNKKSNKVRKNRMKWAVAVDTNMENVASSSAFPSKFGGYSFCMSVFFFSVLFAKHWLFPCCVPNYNIISCMCSWDKKTAASFL